MRTIDTIRLSVRNLIGRKLRSMLTILGISVGIGVVVYLVSLGFGLQQLTLERLYSSSAITVVDVSAPNSTILKINDESVQRFHNIAGVEKIATNSTLPAQIQFKGITSDIIVNGYSGDYIALSNLSKINGENPKSGEMIISSKTREILGESIDSIVHKEITLKLYTSQSSSSGNISEKKFTISGVVKDESAIGWLNYSDIDNLLPKSSEFSGAKIKVNTAENVESVKKQIEDLGFSAFSVIDLVNDIKKAFVIIQYILAGFGVVAVLVASIGMFNTMTIALLERTRDIGIMKAIGARNKDIIKLFMCEATILSTLGGIFGILLARLGSIITNGLVNILASQVGYGKLNIFHYSWEFILFIIVFSFVLGICTGIYPAIRASRLNPLSALRYE